MGLFTSTPRFDNFEQLFVDQLQDLYDAEQRLTRALPKMVEAAHNSELKAALNNHLQETREQVHRLERVFESIGQKAQAKTCEAMKGLITEGEEMVNARGDNDVRDAAIITAAQRVEHYEIAGYGSARTFAERLGHTEAARLLEQTLNEEKNADQKLTAIAENSINIKAQTTMAH